MRNVAAALFILALLFPAAGCRNETVTPDSGSAAESGLRVQVTAEPVSLDPALAEDGISLRILNNVMDGLVGYDGSGAFRTRLAKSYRVLDRGKRYEFILREDAVWSDGQRVKVADFITGFRRALSPKTPNNEAPVFYPIRNAKAYHEGKVGPEELGVRGEDGKLVIELEKTSPYFLQALTLAQAYPIRQDVLDANGGKWPETAPCTGPYRVRSHRIDQKIILERNPHYPMPTAAPPVVTLQIVSDETAAARLFESGALDILTLIPALEQERLKREKVLHVNPFFAVYYVAFNVKKAPFDDRDWRRAVAGSINKEEIVTALGTGEMPARSWIPKGIEGYFSYEDRRAVFADSVRTVAGRPKPSPVSASFDSSHRNSLVMEKIQSDLLKALGLQLSLENLDWKSYVKSIRTDATPMFRFGCLAPFDDPIMLLRLFVTGDPNNLSNFSNPEYDALVEEISSGIPGFGRETKLARAQQILLEEQAVVIPIFHYVQTHAVSPRVRGFRVNPFGVIRFEELTIR